MTTSFSAFCRFVIVRWYVFDVHVMALSSTNVRMCVLEKRLGTSAVTKLYSLGVQYNSLWEYGVDSLWCYSVVEGFCAKRATPSALNLESSHSLYIRRLIVQKSSC